MILFDDNSTSPIAAPLVKRRIIEDAGTHTVCLPRATPVAGLSNTHLSRLAAYMKSTTASAPGRSRGASAAVPPFPMGFAPAAVGPRVGTGDRQRIDRARRGLDVLVDSARLPEPRAEILRAGERREARTVTSRQDNRGVAGADPAFQRADRVVLQLDVHPHTVLSARRIAGATKRTGI